MTAGKGRNRDESSAGHRHNDQLRDSIPRFDLESGCRVGVEHRNSYLSTVSGIHRARAVNNRDAMACCEPASRHDKGDVSVGKRNRDASGNSLALTWSERVMPGGPQVCSGITRMGVCGNVLGGNKNLYVVNHESRLVQNWMQAETRSTKSVCNG